MLWRSWAPAHAAFHVFGSNKIPRSIWKQRGRQACRCSGGGGLSLIRSMTPDISLTASLDRCASLVGFAPRQERPSRARFVPSPSEPLVGGAAEAFDQQIQKLFRNGQRQVTVDLSAVSTIDEAGIRALVRGATSAQRVGGLFRLAAVRPAVARALELSDLSSAFEIYGSVAAARIASWPWRAIRLTAGGIAVCGALVWAGLRWPVGLAGVRDATQILASGQDTDAVDWFQPFIELLKLVAAALVGLLVTAIHQPRNARDRRSLDGAGADAAVRVGRDDDDHHRQLPGARVRHRRRRQHHPIPHAGRRSQGRHDAVPADGLGMSTGLGAFAVAGLGTAFLCVALWCWTGSSMQTPRVSCRSRSRRDGREFPTPHVEGVFARNQDRRSSRARSRSPRMSTVKQYHAWLDPRTSLEDLSAQLMTDGAGRDSGGMGTREARAVMSAPARRIHADRIVTAIDKTAGRHPRCHPARRAPDHAVAVPLQRRGDLRQRWRGPVPAASRSSAGHVARQGRTATAGEAARQC